MRGAPGAVVLFLACLHAPAHGRTIALDDAIEQALKNSGRSRVIQGDLEVAEQQYSAERISFLLPGISINGSLPAYREDQSYRFYGGLPQKTTIKTTDLDVRSNVQLKQNLLTGGEFTARANLWANENEYPLWSDLGTVVDQSTRQGFFEFELSQPLLRPSPAKHSLHNLEDDLEIARLTRREEEAALKREVVEAYFGLLQTDLQRAIATDRVAAAGRQAEIDSAKYADGVLAEEEWLESVSAHLDARLELFDMENRRVEERRNLATILDREIGPGTGIETPPVPGHIDEFGKQDLIRRWEESTPVRKAKFHYEKERRAAEYASSGKGLSGDLVASYASGRGRVVTPDQPDDDIRTNSWELALNFTYPLWDGGASRAAAKAAYLQAERSRLEFESARRAARAEIVDLLNRLDVSYRKLDLLKRRIDFVAERLAIAHDRRESGEISEIEYLQRKIDEQEAEDGYLEELKYYYVTRFELEGRLGG